MIAWQLRANKAVEASWASKAIKSDCEFSNRWSTEERPLQRSLNRAQERALERENGYHGNCGPIKRLRPAGPVKQLKLIGKQLKSYWQTIGKRLESNWKAIGKRFEKNMNNILKTIMKKRRKRKKKIRLKNYYLSLIHIS